MQHGYDFWNINLDEWRTRGFDSPQQMQAAFASPRYATDEQFRQAVTERLARMPEELQPQARVLSEAEVFETSDGISMTRVHADGSTLAADQAALMAVTGEENIERDPVMGAVRLTHIVDGVAIDGGQRKPTVASVQLKLDAMKGLDLAAGRAAFAEMPIAEQEIAHEITRAAWRANN